jgi:hypothetical protein
MRSLSSSLSRRSVAFAVTKSCDISKSTHTIKTHKYTRISKASQRKPEATNAQRLFNVYVP